LGLINVVQSAIGNIISISTATKFTDLTLSQVLYDTLIKIIFTGLVLRTKNFTVLLLDTKAFSRVSILNNSYQFNQNLNSDCIIEKLSSTKPLPLQVIAHCFIS
jgi:hypothetical protein